MNVNRAAIRYPFAARPRSLVETSRAIPHISQQPAIPQHVCFAMQGFSAARITRFMRLRRFWIPSPCRCIYKSIREWDRKIIKFSKNIYDEFRRTGRHSPSLLRDGRSIADRPLLFLRGIGWGTFRLVMDALKGSTSQGETLSGLWILAASSHWT